MTEAEQGIIVEKPGYRRFNRSLGWISGLGLVGSLLIASVYEKPEPVNRQAIPLEDAPITPETPIEVAQRLVIKNCDILQPASENEEAAVHRLCDDLRDPESSPALWYSSAVGFSHNIKDPDTRTVIFQPIIDLEGPTPVAIGFDSETNSFIAEETELGSNPSMSPQRLLESSVVMAGSPQEGRGMLLAPWIGDNGMSDVPQIGSLMEVWIPDVLNNLGNAVSVLRDLPIYAQEQQHQNADLYG